jgi:hypothetical protein
LDVKATDIVVDALGDTAIEVVLPEGGSCLQLSCSGWSSVAGVDAVGGPPHGDFTHDDEVRAIARRRPHRLCILMAGLISDPIGEVGNELGPLGQILAPNGMIMERFWNAGKPRKRPWVSGCGLLEAPVQHGGHVSCRVKFAIGCRCLQLVEWDRLCHPVLTRPPELTELGSHPAHWIAYVRRRLRKQQISCDGEGVWSSRH